MIIFSATSAYSPDLTAASSAFAARRRAALDIRCASPAPSLSFDSFVRSVGCATGVFVLSIFCGHGRSGATGGASGFSIFGAGQTGSGTGSAIWATGSATSGSSRNSGAGEVSSAGSKVTVGATLAAKSPSIC
jgi:hypothetical protein